jgi:hypothetical protein
VTEENLENKWQQFTKSAYFSAVSLLKLNPMTIHKISNGVVHDMPKDLQKALASDKRTLSIWESLTPLARNEWICWTISVKKPETRKEHIRRVVKELKEGVRRPCCWIGCIHRTDKAISPSVKGILVQRTKSKK